MYLDANKLYGWAMSQPLPIGDFKFLSGNYISKLNLFEKTATDPVGYIIECDLEYPPHLHDLHNDYCLAPTKLKVSEDMLSPYQQMLKQKLSISSKNNNENLITKFYDKEKYVVHYINLQIYARQGLKITKIHRILEFTESMA